MSDVIGVVRAPSVQINKYKVVIVGCSILVPLMRSKMVRAKWEGVADKALVIAIEYPLFPLTKP